jgi:TonB family protein
MIKNYSYENHTNSALASVIVHAIIVLSFMQVFNSKNTIDASIRASEVLNVSVVAGEYGDTRKIYQKEVIKNITSKTEQKKLDSVYDIEPAAGISKSVDSFENLSNKKIGSTNPETIIVVKDASVNGTREAPIYPKRALLLNQEGAVLLHVLVDDAGNINEIKIVQPSGFPLLDDAAIEAVKKWQFNATSKDGKWVKSWVEVPIKFSIQS